ncbi:unnamed protein product [Adineta steineri]|uniref:PH domain-containing protein n=1 Tax=Adineta steineri TaxID=433720 RepID=A0A814H639_9BILA|nr:unnamed protein product [Adineta steineri]CAF3801748.1 unnamed protein product [Adineta steineri]
MNRLLVRRCSMSSIEEEDESTASDESQTQKLASSSSSSSQQQLYQSSSILEWDSELSESEEEGDCNDDTKNLTDGGEEQAANRVLQKFIQSSSTTYLNPMKNENSSYTPFSIHLHDEEDSPELDAILSELREFKTEFEENSNFSLYQQQFSISKYNKMEKSVMNYYPSSTSAAKSPSLFSTNGCVNELRTLEDQLEAALASLTLTINDCTIPNIDSQQRSSDSSACSSGLGDEIVQESFHSYNTSNTNHHNIPKFIGLSTDDCDSAFSDSGSTDKVTLPNHEESLIYRSLMPITDSIKETPSIILDPDDALLSHSQHPSKILVRTYNDDGSTKSIFIDDSMLIRDILFVLIHKNHREADINYVLIEILPDLHMERIFEDHQKLTEAILMWPTVSSNRLSFTKRFEKYTFFRTITSNDELFRTPDIEGNIYLKEKSRKSWKKHFCVLRSSGLYYIPKGKSKKDLICLAKFENVELFFGLEWKKKFKSPSDFCFALKHPLIQKKSSKYIKYMCVDTKDEFDRWIINIRLAKFGQQLKINYSFMEKTMNMYRSTGRFNAICSTRSETPIEPQQRNIDIPIHDRRTPIPHNHYYTIHSSTSANNNNNNDEEEEDDDDDNDSKNCPIKSASYMDELRERLERVLNDTPQQCSSPIHSSLQMKEPTRRPTLLPAVPKLKSINSQDLKPSEALNKINNQLKSSLTIGSTPLPRKQIKPSGTLSYRTMDTVNHYHHQQSMSKSFSIPTKREEYRSVSSLSTTSKSESTTLDETDFSLPSSLFLNNFNKPNKTTNTTKPKPIIINTMNINRSKPPVTLKKPMISFRSYTQSQSSVPNKNTLTSSSMKISTSGSQSSKQIKPINNSSIQNSSLNHSKITSTVINNKSVPPVPPRKSSIPRPALTPQPPQRNSSTNLLLRKPQISHL